MKKFLLAITAVAVLVGTTGVVLHFRNHPPLPAASGRYVALGDSVAAGLGLDTKNNASSRSTANPCGRTNESYPTFIAKTLKLQLTSYACSGATTANLTGPNNVTSPALPAQLDAVFASDLATPKLITLTIGANDAHWAELIRACFSDDCTASRYVALADSYLNTLSANLASALDGIKTRSHGTPPTVVVTGYYSPASSDCNQNFKAITPAEIAWVQNESSKLNTVIKEAAAQQNFTKYVAIDFGDHSICSRTPWVQGLLDPAPLHPTVAGQTVIANSIVAALQK